jgi:hypothetical protein
MNFLLAKATGRGRLGDAVLRYGGWTLMERAIRWCRWAEEALEEELPWRKVAPPWPAVEEASSDRRADGGHRRAVEAGTDGTVLGRSLLGPLGLAMRRQLDRGRLHGGPRPLSFVSSWVHSSLPFCSLQFISRAKNLEFLISYLKFSIFLSIIILNFLQSFITSIYFETLTELNGERKDVFALISFFQNFLSSHFSGHDVKWFFNGAFFIQAKRTIHVVYVQVTTKLLYRKWTLGFLAGWESQKEISYGQMDRSVQREKEEGVWG